MKYRSSLWLIFILALVSCKEEDKQIEYLKQDWHCIFSIDGQHYELFNNTHSLNSEPAFSASTGFTLDGNDSINQVGLGTSVRNITDSNGVFFLNIDLFTDDSEILNLYNESFEHKITSISSYLGGINYQKDNQSYDYVYISFKDTLHDLYFNNIHNKELQYDFRIEEVEIYKHAEFGEVLKAKTIFKAKLENQNNAEIKEISGEMMSYYKVPFE